MVLAALLATSSAQTPPSGAIFEGLTFRNIGPATASGRIDDVAVLETNPVVFYVATATGGLWKTRNNGTTWDVLFDDQDDVVSIGAVAIQPNDASVVWVGTGENNNRQSSSWGNGVYKSTDGGQTWRRMGLNDSRHIGRIIIDRGDPRVVYVAATGHLWGPNRERGVFKTTDGGLTWANVLFVNEHTGATDLAMDPANNRVLYAAMYQRQRSNWGFNGGGPGSGIYKTTDAGRTWVRLTNGIPSAPIGRIGIDVYRRNPAVVYATIEHATDGGTYRSADSGRRWIKVSDLNPRPMYFSQIRIDPNNDQRIYVLGVLLHISDDGGKTFSTNSSMHGDHHAMWINPANSNHVMTGSDGGVGLSYDRGKTWDFIDNMDLGQFYHVGYDMDSPYRVYGGMQDNESWGGPSAVRSLYGHYHGVGGMRRTGIANLDWFLLGGGDGFVAVADPTDSRTIYSESQGGNITRVDRLSNERKAIKPQAPEGQPPLRWNWNTPLMISSHASSTIYAAANRVLRSVDRGHSWTVISPDLTAQLDRETFSLMNVPAKDFNLSKHDGVSAFGTLVAFAESPKRKGLFYAGADDGTIHVSPDGGRNWTNVTGRFSGLPRSTPPARFAPSLFDEGTVYAVFDGHGNDDYTPYAFVSNDFGGSWRAIAAGLPSGHVLRSITEDHRNPDVLYVGSEFGLFVSIDRGRQWVRFRSGLPTVPVFGITLHPRENDLILASHGRSVWILDDLSPLQQWAAAPTSDVQLFDARPATQFIGARDRITEGDRRFLGRNPEFGAAISYYLKQPVKNLHVAIRDAGGAPVREIRDQLPIGAGINRIYWDLRHDPLPLPAGMQPPSGFFGQNPLDGPFVLPGAYQVTLTVEGTTAGPRTITVVGDPLMPISNTDRRTLHDAALSLHEMLRAANAAATTVRGLTEQLKLVKTTFAPSASVVSLVDELDKRLTFLTGPSGPRTGASSMSSAGVIELRGRISALKAQVMGSTSVPTDDQAREMRNQREQLERIVRQVNTLIVDEMGRLYDALREHGIDSPLVKPVPLITIASLVHS